MGRVTVKFNNMPKVIRQMPKEADTAVDATALSLERYLEGSLWRDTGMVVSTTKAEIHGPKMHSTVGVGEVEGRGFYALFREFGAFNKWAGERLGPDPRVAPAGQAHEPVLRDEMAKAVRRACREASQ